MIHRTIVFTLLVWTILHYMLDISVSVVVERQIMRIMMERIGESLVKGRAW